MQDLDMRQMMEYQEERKSMAVTYVLWGFLGAFGAHRFYLGETGTAVAQLILTLTIIGLIVSAIWVLVDACLIPRMVKDINYEIMAEITGHS